MWQGVALGEGVLWTSIVGAAIIIIGTAIVTYAKARSSRGVVSTDNGEAALLAGADDADCQGGYGSIVAQSPLVSR